MASSPRSVASSVSSGSLDRTNPARPGTMRGREVTYEDSLDIPAKQNSREEFERRASPTGSDSVSMSGDSDRGSEGGGAPGSLKGGTLDSGSSLDLGEVDVTLSAGGGSYYHLAADTRSDGGSLEEEVIHYRQIGGPLGALQRYTTKRSLPDTRNDHSGDSFTATAHFKRVATVVAIVAIIVIVAACLVFTHGGALAFLATTNLTHSFAASGALFSALGVVAFVDIVVGGALGLRHNRQRKRLIERGIFGGTIAHTSITRRIAAGLLLDLLRGGSTKEDLIKCFHRYRGIARDFDDAEINSEMQRALQALPIEEQREVKDAITMALCEENDLEGLESFDIEFTIEMNLYDRFEDPQVLAGHVFLLKNWTKGFCDANSLEFLKTEKRGRLRDREMARDQLSKHPRPALLLNTSTQVGYGRIWIEEHFDDTKALQKIRRVKPAKLLMLQPGDIILVGWAKVQPDHYASMTEYVLAEDKVTTCTDEDRLKVLMYQSTKFFHAADALHKKEAIKRLRGIVAFAYRELDVDASFPDKFKARIDSALECSFFGGDRDLYILDLALDYLKSGDELEFLQICAQYNLDEELLRRQPLDNDQEEYERTLSEIEDPMCLVKDVDPTYLKDWEAMVQRLPRIKRQEQLRKLDSPELLESSALQMEWAKCHIREAERKSRRWLLAQRRISKSARGDLAGRGNRRPDARSAGLRKKGRLFHAMLREMAFGEIAGMKTPSLVRDWFDAQRGLYTEEEVSEEQFTDQMATGDDWSSHEAEYLRGCMNGHGDDAFKVMEYKIDDVEIEDDLLVQPSDDGAAPLALVRQRVKDHMGDRYDDRKVDQAMRCMTATSSAAGLAALSGEFSSMHGCRILPSTKKAVTKSFNLMENDRGEMCVYSTCTSDITFLDGNDQLHRVGRVTTVSVYNIDKEEVSTRYRIDGRVDG